MHGYDLAAWAGFFTAVTGAAAALTGLLFVAVSINLKNILAEGKSMLPSRAAETLAMLLFVVVSSALALVPQDIEPLGAEIRSGRVSYIGKALGARHECGFGVVVATPNPHSWAAY